MYTPSIFRGRTSAPQQPHRFSEVEVILVTFLSINPAARLDGNRCFLSALLCNNRLLFLTHQSSLILNVSTVDLTAAVINLYLSSFCLTTSRSSSDDFICCSSSVMTAGQQELWSNSIVLSSDCTDCKMLKKYVNENNYMLNSAASKQYL